ncbi:MAG: adenylate kinase [Epsilonproteobacteria bacterium]|nr:adenylate kinase [Campylobacterota bacterium]
MKKLFLIIGAPGSGKTTDASLIAERHPHKIAHFSTGDLLRAEVARGTQLGKTIASYVDNGNLVPLDIVIDTIVTAIKSSNKDVILVDGFPRSVEQMKALDEILQKEKDIQLVSVIEVEVSQEVAKDRVLGRARGADDNERVFNNRMQVYLQPLKEIQDFYQSKGLLHKINGERSIEEIVDEMDHFIQGKI